MVVEAITALVGILGFLVAKDGLVCIRDDVLGKSGMTNALVSLGSDDRIKNNSIVDTVSKSIHLTPVTNSMQSFLGLIIEELCERFVCLQIIKFSFK